MISRVTMKSSGLCQYLISGKRVDSPLSREQKDSVIPLYGSLKLLQKAEEYCIKEKKWKYNYEHITISFSDEDIYHLESLSNFEENLALQDIAKMMIKHRTNGYDLENEVIAYSELHNPKIKEEISPINGEIKKRRKHIHIGISYLNPISNKQLRTTFYNNSYISDTIDRYIAKKHNLTVPLVIPKTKETKMMSNRQKLKKEVQNFTTEKELYSYLHINKIEYGFTNINSKNPSNLYVLNEKGRKIHLRGKDFLNIEAIINPNIQINQTSNMSKLKEKSLDELEEILNKYYRDYRTPMIEKRRSFEDTRNLYFLTEKETEEEIKYQNTGNQIVAPKSAQNKIFLSYYKAQTEINLKGFFIDTNNKNNIKIINKNKKIHIRDTGTQILSTSNGANIEEEVKIMLDIARAKGWEFHSLRVRGSEKFKKETYRQIALEIEVKKKKILRPNLSTLLNVSYQQTLKRPMTPLHQKSKKIKEEKEADKKKTSLVELKEKIDPYLVLNYAKSKFYLDLENYKIEGQKINNIKNRQKVKNAIDFFQKECNLSTKEAIEICEKIYLTQKEDKEVISKVKNTKKDVKNLSFIGYL